MTGDLEVQRIQKKRLPCLHSLYGSQDSIWLTWSQSGMMHSPQLQVCRRGVLICWLNFTIVVRATSGQMAKTLTGSQKLMESDKAHVIGQSKDPRIAAQSMPAIGPWVCRCHNAFLWVDHWSGVKKLPRWVLEYFVKNQVDACQGWPWSSAHQSGWGRGRVCQIIQLFVVNHCQ